MSRVGVGLIGTGIVSLLAVGGWQGHTSSLDEKMQFYQNLLYIPTTAISLYGLYLCRHNVLSKDRYKHH